MNGPDSSYEINIFFNTIVSKTFLLLALLSIAFQFFVTQCGWARWPSTLQSSDEISIFVLTLSLFDNNWQLICLI